MYVESDKLNEKVNIISIAERVNSNIATQHPKSALKRAKVKLNALRLLTTMRNVDIGDCENMFIED